MTATTPTLSGAQQEALRFVVETGERRAMRGRPNDWQSYEGRMTRSFPALVRQGLLEGSPEVVRYQAQRGKVVAEKVWKVRPTAKAKRTLEHEETAR